MVEPTPEDAEILQLLASDDPPTGEMMAEFSVRMKAAACILNVHEFMALAAAQQRLVCDARSPGEFSIGHIPGATNLPLFSDSERATVGTLYSTNGRSDATVAGMAFVQPKLDSLVSAAKEVVRMARSSSDDSEDILLLHCWRGGMRSCALAFLIQTRIPELRVYVLEGGYRAFRKWQNSIYCYLPENASHDASYDVNRASFKGIKKKNFTQKQRLKYAKRAAAASGVGATNRDADIERRRSAVELEDAADIAAAEAQWKADTEEAALAQKEWEVSFARYKGGPRIVIIGGPTGSGKTKVLHALRDVLGEQVIDLEGLANHSGSAFGFVGHDPQPTPQQYTNDVAMEWASLDPERWVFIEDEGPNVGRVNLPVGLYRKMRTAPVVLKLDIPRDIRVQVLRTDYVLPEKEKGCNLSEWLSSMVEATRTLEKRIGSVRVEAMLTLLREGKYSEFASIALEYYDDLYHKHITSEHGSANMTGNGERAAAISTVTVDDMKEFDAVKVARQVQATLRLTSAAESDP